MTSLDLRDLTADDVDAAAHLLPKGSADGVEGMLRRRALLITAHGVPAAVAVSSDADGERRIELWLGADAPGDDVVSLMTEREADRPLSLRLHPEDAASDALLNRLGFVPADGQGEFVLPPTLE